MSTSNPYDPINALLRFDNLPMMVMHHASEAKWILENNKKSDQPATEDDIAAFESAHASWKSLDDEVRKRAFNIEVLLENAVNREKSSVPLIAGVDGILATHPKALSLTDIDRWMIVRLINPNTQKESLAAEISTIIEYVEMLRKPIEIGPEPKRPEFHDELLHKEFEKRLHEFDAYEKILKRQLKEFELASRAWHLTTNEDYEPLQNLSRNGSLESSSVAAKFIADILIRCRSEKERLKSATPAPKLAVSTQNENHSNLNSSTNSQVSRGPLTLPEIWSVYQIEKPSAQDRIRKKLDYAVKRRQTLLSYVFRNTKEQEKAYDAELVRAIVDAETKKHGK